MVPAPIMELFLFQIKVANSQNTLLGSTGKVTGVYGDHGHDVPKSDTDYFYLEAIKNSISENDALHNYVSPLKAGNKSLLLEVRDSFITPDKGLENLFLYVT